MATFPKNCWRITKYNPAFRDEKGAYIKDEWVSFSDIGLSFDEETLTFEKYRRVEDAYVFTALRFLFEAGLESLKVKSLEKNKPTVEKAKFVDIPYNPKLIRNSLIISGKNLESICRLVLRDVIWCRLEYESDFYIHFGWDYYMYVGSPIWSNKAIEFGIRQNLFIEEMASPYIFSNDKNKESKPSEPKI